VQAGEDAHGHGYILAEMLAAIELEALLVVEEALWKKNNMIASSVFT
jgi:hypothetical protein